MFAFGWLVYRLIISRVVERDLFTSLLATFGLAIVLQQSLNLMFGSDVQSVESGFEVRSILDNSVTVADIRLISFLLAAALATAIIIFMRRSRMGQANMTAAATGTS